MATAFTLAVAGFGAAGGFPSVEQAVELAFPGAEIERETLFLTEAQLAEVASASGEKGQGAVVTRFAARRADAVVGWAYVDTHRVRTLPESLVVALGPDGAVRRIEVVAFREPPEFLPRERWYSQFEGRALDGELNLKRAIRPVTGATLTAAATTAAVRRILAVHRVATKAMAATP